MSQEREVMSREDAAHEVELVSRRLGLLHLAYARALVDTLGEDEGRRLILKAIKLYGTWIGREVRAAVQEAGLAATPDNYGIDRSRSLPLVGMHERSEVMEVGNEKRLRAYGCVMAKVWKTYGEERLGRLYCYVDPAKYMAYNPDYKLAHVKALPDGDPYCEFCLEETTAEERDAFVSTDKDWSWVDQCGGQDGAG